MMKILGNYICSYQIDFVAVDPVDQRDMSLQYTGVGWARKDLLFPPFY